MTKTVEGHTYGLHICIHVPAGFEWPRSFIYIHIIIKYTTQENGNRHQDERYQITYIDTFTTKRDHTLTRYLNNGRCMALTIGQNTRKVTNQRMIMQTVDLRPANYIVYGIIIPQ